MKKQVNLYQPSCHPKREKATFTQLLALFTLCLLVSISAYFVAIQQTKSLNKQLTAHQVAKNQQQLLLSDLVVELQKKRAPEAKIRLHAALQNELKAKQRLLSTIDSIDIEELVSFSALMRGLSYADMPDLTINHFSMVGGILNIEGDAKQSDSVPLWLSNMQTTTELSSVAFKAISINEVKGVFSFQLSNRDLQGKGR